MPSLGSDNPEKVYNFSISNMILMVGGQILVIVLLLMIAFFGVAPLSFPANAVRNIVSKRNPIS
jgi:hypothetical protein